MGKGKKLTFKKYLEWAAKEDIFGDTPEGDFVGDALRDRELRDYEEWEWTLLAGYIRIKGGCREAVESAKVVFHKWLAS